MKRLLAAMVITIAAGGFVWLAYAFYSKTDIGRKPPLTLENGTYFAQQARALPEWALHDSQANKFGSQQWAGRWSFVFLGYTSCPDICPPTIMQMQRFHQFASRKGIEPPQMVFISVDTERDTPERIQQFLGQFGKEVVGLNGEAQTIQELSRFFGTYSQRRNSEDDGAYLIDHSSKLFVISPQGRLIAMLNPPFTNAGMADHYRRMRTDHAFIARR